MTATFAPIVTPDTARTRLTDPLSSHVAADRSSASIRGVKDRVLCLLAIHGPMNGLQINEAYELSQPRLGWADVSWDSPRKRAGSLAADGELIILNDLDPRGTPRVYALPGYKPTPEEVVLSDDPDDDRWMDEI